jgi:predicted nucleic acid-binding protein
VTRFAVIDTNVVVSGLLNGVADSPTRRVVDGMLAGTIPFVLSETLLAEYRAVLLRPAISRRHGLSETEVDVLLEEVVLNASIRDPATGPQPLPPAGSGRDARTPGSALADTGRLTPSGDEHVIELLRAVPGAVLVTGDRRLAEAVGSWSAALTPAEFAGTLVDEGDR